MEWKNNHTIADHASSMPCEECHGANLLSARTQFTTKITQRKTEDAPTTEESSATDHFRDTTKMVSGESSAPTPTQPQ